MAQRRSEYLRGYPISAAGTRRFLRSPELYDAIYQFKDYARECQILRALIARNLPGARSILDVACGTGEHARFLQHHYAVDGVDINDRYLAVAQRKNPSGRYTRADMTDFNLGHTYEVVTCLFSAIGIVRTYGRLEQAITCMARHLRPGGVLIVEPWFTPQRWRPGRSSILAGKIGANHVYRLSSSIQQGDSSVLLHHYLLATDRDIEHYREQIELGLFTRDEITWAFEFAQLDVHYDDHGLIGRGLYIGRKTAPS
jgi:SAM-dependent methyltransferase